MTRYHPSLILFGLAFLFGCALLLFANQAPQAPQPSKHSQATQAQSRTPREPSPSPAPARTAVPEDSVYQLQARFTNQDNAEFVLAERAGGVQLVAMFYSSCKYVCPLIIGSARGVQKALTPKEQAKLQILLVSFDTVRDTPARLKATAAEHKLDLKTWTLARTTQADVRKLAALLGLRYRELAEGEFNHTSELILLDANGRIMARTDKMTPIADPEFLAKVRAALK
jgi:protein SCO1